MKISITDPTSVHLEDVPEDEHLVIYLGQLCIREPDHSNVYTVEGIMQDAGRKSFVQRIKSIKVEI